MRALVAPPRVQPGDTVAIVSPSAPAIAMWPHRVERGRAYLESLGLRVRVMPNAGARSSPWLAGTPEQRVADIHEAFLDDSISAIVASIGGNHSNQLLPLLDFELIRSHPKIFQGYSDVTVLLWAIAERAGLRTFHGPALTLEMAEYPDVLPFTDRFLRAAWSGDEPIRFEPADEWTEEFLDFFQKADLTRPRTLQPNDGWLTIREGSAEGPLLGGCLETIIWHLKGSAVWPDLSGALLFLETSELAPSPPDVEAYLVDLEQLGVFDSIMGLVVGRPMRYSADHKQVLMRIVAEHTAAAGIPVLANVDLGHTDPMLTLPIGTRARLDTRTKEFALLEPATSAPSVSQQLSQQGRGTA